MLRVLCCVGLLGMLFAAPVQAELKVGDAAPTFKLTGSDGKTYDLADMKGKYVVVAWYPKAFTGGCTAECKSFAKDGALLKAYDIMYFTASCDTVEQNTKFAKEEIKADYPILSDPTREVAKAYGLVDSDKGNAKRVTFVIGPDGKIADIETKVKTAEAAKQMADKLAALKVPAKK